MEYSQVKFEINSLACTGNENEDLVRMQLGYLKETFTDAKLLITDSKGKIHKFIVNEILEANLDEIVEL